jgi:hypothetical protein
MSKKAKREPKLLAAPIQYTYYVTYSFDSGNGYSVINLDWPITNHDRIQIVVQMIRKGANIKQKIILTNWILL